MYNIYCDNINTLGYERKQNGYIVLLLYIWSCKHTAAKDLLTISWQSYNYQYSVNPVNRLFVKIIICLREKVNDRKKTCRYTTLKMKTIKLKKREVSPLLFCYAFELINNIHNVHRTRCHPVSGTIVGILIFISRKKFMLSWVEHEIPH